MTERLVSGTGPLAFASFVFDPGNTAQHSIVIVPRIIVGRRNGQSWLTVLGGADAQLPGMPDQTQRPARPGARYGYRGERDARAVPVDRRGPGPP